MSSNHEKAKRHNQHHSKIHAHATDHKNNYRKHPSGAVVPEHHRVQNLKRVIVRQAPTSAVNPAFLNGGTCDVRMEKGTIDLLTHAYLQFDLTNSTGGASTIAPLQLAIERIEIYAGNGNQLLTTIYGQELWLTNAFLSRDEWEQSASLFGSTTAYSTAGIAIADGASTVLYCPLIHMLPSVMLHMAGLDSELIVRVVMQTSTYTILAGSNITCNSINLIMKGYSEPEDVKQKRLSVYRNSIPYIVPYVNFQRMNQTITLAASSTYSIVLSGFKGQVGAFFITLRAAAITAANQGTYLALSSLDVQNAAGESLTGHYRRTHSDVKLENSELLPNVFGNNKEFYLLSWSENPAHDYQSGSNSGYEYFTGFEKLSFTTTSGLAGGSYIVDIRALSYEHLTILNGKAHSSKN